MMRFKYKAVQARPWIEVTHVYDIDIDSVYELVERIPGHPEITHIRPSSICSNEFRLLTKDSSNAYPDMLPYRNLMYVHEVQKLFPSGTLRVYK